VNPASRLLIGGIGPPEELIRSKIREADFDEDVVLLGLRSDVPALMQAADAFVLSPVWEGLSSEAKVAPAVDPIASCQQVDPQVGSKSAPLRQTPQTMLSAFRMQWPSAFILDLPADRFRA